MIIKLNKAIINYAKDINTILIGSLLWIITGIIIWSGSLLSIVVWLIAYIWFITFIYIINRITIVHFGFPKNTIVNIFFDSFNRVLALAGIALLVGTYTILISTLTIVFSWLVKYLNIPISSYQVLISTVFFLFTIYILKYWIKKLILPITIIQILSIIMLVVLVIIGILKLVKTREFIFINDISWINLPFFFGLILFQFSAITFWRASGVWQEIPRVVLKTKISIILAISVLQLLLILAVPQLMSDRDLLIKTNFLPHYFNRLISENLNYILGYIIIAQVIGNGIFSIHLLDKLLFETVKIDYKFSQTKHPWHLRNLKFGKDIIIILLISFMGWLIINDKWDILILVKIGGYCIIALSILLTIPYLEMEKKKKGYYLGGAFIVFNLIISLFFGWSVLLALSFIFLGMVIEFMRILRQKEKKIVSSSKLSLMKKIGILKDN